MSRVFDDFSLHQTPFQLRVDVAYKRKADKVKRIDTSLMVPDLEETSVGEKRRCVEKRLYMNLE